MNFQFHTFNLKFHTLKKYTKLKPNDVYHARKCEA